MLRYPPDPIGSASLPLPEPCRCRIVFALLGLLLGAVSLEAQAPPSAKASSEVEAYERFVGRWSRLLAVPFMKFAGVRDGDRVIDVGTGAGPLAITIATANPNSEVIGVDPSDVYIDHAWTLAENRQTRFYVSDMGQLPFDSNSFDHCLSLILMNPVPDLTQVLVEMHRVTRPGGTIAAAVWDCAGGMQMSRVFWDAAASLDPKAASLDERHSPYCRQGELAGLWGRIQLEQIEEKALAIPLEFSSFDDFWQPFLGGLGPAGAYVASLSDAARTALRERLKEKLLSGKADGPFALQAKAWAVRGKVPER